VKVNTPGLQQIGEATTTSSIFSANDPRVHFGLGGATEADIEVRWPSGKVQNLPQVPANRIAVIDEDKGLILPERAK
jgi:hypothetical protein